MKKTDLLLGKKRQGLESHGLAFRRLLNKISIFLLVLLIQVAANAQGRAVSGVVLDENGEGLVGATVLEKGTTNGTIADISGNYTLNVSSDDATLIISFVGYTAQEIVIGTRTSVDVSMVLDAQQLEDVVVIGYGVQKKSSVTASVATVDVTEATKNITHDPALSIQGRATGVQVLTQGGIAGAEAKIVIRGTGTFGNTEPLYVIDGAFSTVGLRALNPADIESIEILKDGSAAAIYGSRAANGVVLITTKKGKKGTPVVQLSSSVSIQTLGKKLDYANASEWRKFSNQIADNDGNPRVPEDENPNHSSGVDTDWQDEWFRSAPIFNTTIGVSGGSDYTTYSASIGYLKQEGILKFSQFEKYNARLNLGFKKGKFELTNNLGIAFYENDPNNHFSVGGTGGSGFNLPTVPIKDSNGKYIAAGSDFYHEGEGRGNPILDASIDPLRIRNIDVTGNIGLAYQIIDGLKYKIDFSGSFNSESSFDKNSLYTIDILGGTTDHIVNNVPFIDEAKNSRTNFTIDNIVTYDKSFGSHDISALAGYSQFRVNNEFSGVNVVFSDEVYQQQRESWDGDATASGEKIESLLASWFGRVNYAYDSRYLVSVTLRQDKSSKFADGNNVGTFPSFSAGWNVHNESFFPSDGFINRLKVRGGYGELGANFIDPYQFSSVAFGPIPAIFGDNQQGPGDRSFGYVTQILDPGLKWETSKSTNLGLEFGFMDDALTFTVEYFKKTNENVLAPVPLPPSAGQTILINTGRAPDVNSSTIENKGLEFLVDYKNAKNVFKYNVSLNLSTIKNEVVTLGENVVPIVGGLISGSFDDRPGLTDAGGPVGAFYGFKTQGIDDDGNFIYADVNGRDKDGNLTGKPDGQIDFDDRVLLGDPFPDFTYGINFSGEYQNFDFSLFLQGSQGGEIFSQIKYSNYFVYTGNVVKDALNAWTPSNKNTGIPKATLNNRAGGNALPSDFYVEDGSYLRLKNIQVGYTVPGTIIKGLSNARIYIGAQNLLTFTGYSGYDPEVSSDAVFNRGIDFRGYPNARTFTLGFNATF